MVKVLAICGGSGSGKSFLAHAIKENLPQDTVVLSYDNYYRDQSHLNFQEREKLNYDDPAQIDGELFLQHLQALKNGESVRIPQYDFASHTRKKVSKPLNSAEWIICEGIMLLTLPRDSFDFAIYVDADDDVRLARRIERDITLRGRTIESVITQYLANVKPMHKKHVEPCRKLADFVYLNNHNNGIDRQQLESLLFAVHAKLG